MNYQRILLVPDILVPVAMVFEFYYRPEKGKEREIPDIQAGFRKGRVSRDHTDNICWITEKAREFQKNIYFCFIDYPKVFV